MPDTQASPSVKKPIEFYETLPPVPVKQVLVANRYAGNGLAEGITLSSIGGCCGCAIITPNWHWQGVTERYGEGWNIFDGVVDETKMLPEAIRELKAYARYLTNPDTAWKTYRTLKDKTYLLVGLKHKAEDLLARLYSEEFKQTHRVSGMDFSDAEQGDFCLVWVEKKE